MKDASEAVQTMSNFSGFIRAVRAVKKRFRELKHGKTKKVNL